jgi:hypothetical protein
MDRLGFGMQSASVQARRDVLGTRLLVLWASVLLCSACAHDVVARVRGQASAELRCARDGLRVRVVGTLRGPGRAPVELHVVDAEGCDAERRYFCVPGGACATTLAAVVPAASRAGLHRALWLLRTQTRGRCPGDTQRVVQESESLFQLETCDGLWPYHCRAAGCERLR